MIVIPNPINEKSTIKEMTFFYVYESFRKERFDGIPQKEIVDKVVLFKNSFVSEECGYPRENIQPAVSRALKALIEEKKIIKLKKNTYLPFNRYKLREIIEEEIKKNIIFERPDIFVASNSVILLPVAPKSLHFSKEIFRQYLGEDDCYDILEYSGYLVLMLVGTDTHLKALRLKIGHIVEQAYILQNR
ncbi:MAG: hypothetical protein IJA05_06195 [Oscillospiraceae bacterium]|nr:hypothetical protein [Oscillospiraceae bacterium]